MKLEPVPDGGGVEIPVRAVGKAGMPHDRIAIDDDFGVGGIAGLLKDDLTRRCRRCQLGGRTRGRRRVAVVVELELLDRRMQRPERAGIVAASAAWSPAAT
jgi:hypothetical protein